MRGASPWALAECPVCGAEQNIAADDRLFAFHANPRDGFVARTIAARKLHGDTFGNPRGLGPEEVAREARLSAGR